MKEPRPYREDDDFSDNHQDSPYNYDGSENWENPTEEGLTI